VNASAERIGALLMDRFAGRVDCYLKELKPEERPPDKPWMTGQTVYEPLTPPTNTPGVESIASRALGRPIQLVTTLAGSELEEPWARLRELGFEMTP
jgi:hypothetical protein